MTTTARVETGCGQMEVEPLPHASHIRGMPGDEGRALLKELLEFATRDDFTYLHHWRVGDLVMYDNRAALHRGRPYKITEHARVLHRTTVAGEGPTVPT